MLTFLFWSTVVLTVVPVIVSITLSMLPSKEIYLRHYTSLANLRSIESKGFHAPTTEQKVLKDSVGAYYSGQCLQDKVSFSYVKDSAFSKMLDRTTKGATGYLYIKVPVNTLNSKLVTAYNCFFGIYSYEGIGVEYVIDRDLVNKAIEEGKYTYDLPKGYINYWGILTLVMGVVNGSTHFLLGTINLVKAKLLPN